MGWRSLNRMYRWGYYLGTGALNRNELGLALHALAAQAQKQGDPIIRRTYEALERRLRGLNLELDGQLFYPVRTQLSRMIMQTDPTEMMKAGKYRRTLFHQLEELEEAIATGNIIQINRSRDPYGNMGLGPITIYPLQLMYSDMAWYLLYEYAEKAEGGREAGERGRGGEGERGRGGEGGVRDRIQNPKSKIQNSLTPPLPHSLSPPPGHLEIERLDRFSDAIKIFPDPPRGTQLQLQQLTLAHELLEQGWGLYLGNPDQQLLERQGELPLTTVKTRFFYPKSQFILEGDQRHSTQTMIAGHDGTDAYVDYVVQLPERSLNEFLRWVYRFMGDALVLTPDHLVAKHRQAVLKAEGRTKG